MMYSFDTRYIMPTTRKQYSALNTDSNRLNSTGYANCCFGRWAHHAYLKDTSNEHLIIQTWDMVTFEVYYPRITHGVWKDGMRLGDGFLSAEKWFEYGGW